jgi:hypothetical protein
LVSLPDEIRGLINEFQTGKSRVNADSSHFRYTSFNLFYFDDFSEPFFSILVFSLSLYMEANGGHPPLSGNIPDMTAFTKWFVQLQQVAISVFPNLIFHLFHRFIMLKLKVTELHLSGPLFLF